MRGYSPRGTALAGALVAWALAVQGCGGPVYRVQTYDVPGEPGLKGHQKPYSVNGAVYHPLRSPDGFEESGVASWYGPDFHGRKTSCGEVYDMHALTAAHKVLPMGVHVRVTNRENGRSVVVRVNDRGPFVKGRIIDLSYAAARELDMTRKGTAPVRVEALGFGVVDARGNVAYTRPASFAAGNFTVQIGAFAQRENAERLALKMRERYGAATIQEGWVNGTLFHRVRVGSYPSLDAAEAASRRFEGDGYESAFVIAID